MARASEYCRKSDGRKPEFNSSFGCGQEGYVWPVEGGVSAIKVFERRKNYEIELGCYEILDAHKVTEVYGFNIPQLIGWSEELLIIEMTIVKPPFILDFGKSSLYFKPEYPSDAVDHYQRQLEETFGEYLPQVELALSYLESLGIFYIDASGNNIKVEGLSLEFD